MLKLCRLWLVLLLCTACASADRPLQLLGGQGPVYPDAARQQGIEGEVVVAYDVSAQGVVENVRVIAGQPAGIFEQAALAAVRSWKFAAPVLDGVSQPARNLRSTVAFKLDGASEYDQY